MRRLYTQVQQTNLVLPSGTRRCNGSARGGRTVLGRKQAGKQSQDEEHPGAVPKPHPRNKMSQDKTGTPIGAQSIANKRAAYLFYKNICWVGQRGGAKGHHRGANFGLTPYFNRQCGRLITCRYERNFHGSLIAVPIPPTKRASKQCVWETREKVGGSPEPGHHAMVPSWSRG